MSIYVNYIQDNHKEVETLYFMFGAQLSLNVGILKQLTVFIYTHI